VHDFHPPIAASGLYWVTPVPESGLTISADGRSATLDIRNVPVIDQPKWPEPNAPVTPARLSLRVQWKATSESADTDGSSKMFRFRGFRAIVKMEASVEVPSLGFRWKSDPMESSEAKFGIIGEEVNGRYYSL